MLSVYLLLTHVPSVAHASNSTGKYMIQSFFRPTEQYVNTYRTEPYEGGKVRLQTRPMACEATGRTLLQSKTKLASALDWPRAREATRDVVHM